jgi:hypothetical protein
MHGDTGPPNLINSLFAMGHGYLQPRLIFDFLIHSAAELMGTVSRCPLFPFSFDQVIKPTDPREDVSLKGLKALLLKNVKCSNKKITTLTYWDGKGGVTLGNNTMICSREWDLGIFDPYDAEQFRRTI